MATDAGLHDSADIDAQYNKYFPADGGDGGFDANDDDFDMNKYRPVTAPILQSGSRPLKPSMVARKNDNHILYGTAAKIHPYSIVVNQKPEQMAEEILRLREDLNRMIKRSVSGAPFFHFLHYNCSQRALPCNSHASTPRSRAVPRPRTRYCCLAACAWLLPDAAPPACALSPRSTRGRCRSGTWRWTSAASTARWRTRRSAWSTAWCR